MPGKTLIDRAVDLLTDVAGETLPALAAGGGKLLDPFLFQTLAEFGLASPFLAITFLSCAETPVKGAVALAVAGGEKVGNADVHADHRSRWRGLDGNHLIIAQG